MFARGFLPEELGDSAGMSRSAVALCCAIIEDAEVAREFELEPRSAAAMMRIAMIGPSTYCHDPSPLPRELTSLIA
jgi:hypothetical protein